MAKRRKGGKDAIALLKEDHQAVKKAFRKFEKMDHEDSEAVEKLVKEVCTALKVHTMIEEEVFYPAAREAIEDDDLMNEAKVEHQSAKDLIEQLENGSPDDPMYAAVFTVLGEYVNHHVEEEEGEMFPAARKAKMDLKALGEELAARKAELMKEMAG